MLLPSIMIGPPPREAFTAKELKLIQRLRTPAHVQRWLTSMPYNWERQGGTMRSFREVVRRNEAHCLEAAVAAARSEEHTSELQSHSDLVCRLLLEKKKQNGAQDLLRDYATAVRHTTDLYTEQDWV